MSIKSLLAFLLRFAVVGLALAFVVVLIKPDLIRARVPQPNGQPTSALLLAGPGSYASAVARSAPAVVNIYSQRVVNPAPRASIESLMGDRWPLFRDRIEQSLGSGVIVDANGRIVTNNHVVPEGAAIMVEVSDGRAAPARVIGRDPDTDLALLQVELDDLPTMPLGRSDTLRVGDVVLAIGNPVGLSQTVTQGIISATGRGLRLNPFEDFIQTDAAINIGNSGGALVNVNGELVGINTAVFSRSVGIEGIGFAIPVNLVRGVVNELARNGRVIRGWLGVLPDDLPAQQARTLGLSPGRGIVVVNLYLEGPAYRAGVRPGDVLTYLDDLQLSNAQQALAAVASMAPGKSVRVRGLRGGKPFALAATIEERPKS